MTNILHTASVEMSMLGCWAVTKMKMVYFVPGDYSQTGCSFDGNSAMLWCNVPILIASLLYTTCNFEFKFA